MAVTIGSNLKQARMNRKMTQNEVAAILHVTPQAVSKWERNESLPDVTLLPEIASLYQTSIDGILSPPKQQEAEEDIASMIEKISGKINDSLFERLVKEYKNTTSAMDLMIQPDIFIFLSTPQKDCLLQYLIHMEDNEAMLEETLSYLSRDHRSQVIERLQEEKKYKELEGIIPVIPKLLKDKVIRQATEDEQFDFVEEMLPYLNREQKSSFVEYLIEHPISIEAMEDLIIYFDNNQRRRLESFNSRFNK